MLKKILLSLLACLLCQTLFAESCPSIHELKKNAFKDWKAYDSDDNKPLSTARFQSFVKAAQQFVMAEWSNKDHQGGTIHCYYRNSNGSNLEAYLEKKHFIPENSQDFWYDVSGSKQCAAGMQKCIFKNITMQQPQLAKK